MNALQKFREDKNLKRADMARLLGVSKATITRWETGDRRVDIKLLSSVEEKTGLKREDLRPDIFGEAA